MIIDAHIHVGAWSHADFLGRACDLDGTLRMLRESGLDGAALTSSDQFENAALLDELRRAVAPGGAWHGRGPLWFLPWVRPVSGDGLGEADLAFLRAHAPQLAGVKLHPSLARRRVTDDGYRAILEFAEEHALTVLVHCGRWTEMAGFEHALAAAARHPGARFVLAHAGGDTPPLATGAARAVKTGGLANVWLEVSGLREYWVLERNVELLGADRYLLGSDFPLAHPLMYVGALSGSRLSPEQRRRILGENALEVLGPPLGGERVAAGAAPTGTAADAHPVVGGDGARPTDAGATRRRLTVLVTGAGGPLGVNTTRSLKAAPGRPRLIGTDANRWHLPLALTDVTVRIPPARDRDGYAAAMEELVASENVDVIVPTHPVEVRAVATLLEAGRLRGVSACLPRRQVLERADDKFATQQVLERAGVPVPRTLLLQGPADLERAFAEMATPVWVRGSGAPGLGIGTAALPCRNLGTAQAWVEHHHGWGGMVACAYLPGRNLTWMSAWQHGRLLAAAARERLEYVLPHVSPSGITGAPAVTRTVRRPEMSAIAERAVRALDSDPHGVYFVDLKEDEAGRPCVTEINAGRCGTTVHFYTEAGLNFPWLIVCLAAGLDLDWLPAHPEDAVPEGLYWVRTLDCGPVLLRSEAEFDRYRTLSAKGPA